MPRRKITPICQTQTRQNNLTCVITHSQRSQSALFFDSRTTPTIVHSILTLLDVYRTLDSISLQRPPRTASPLDFKLSVLFRRPMIDGEAYDLSVHKQLFGSRFSVDSATSTETALSGSYRYVDEQARRPKYIARVPGCDGMQIRQYQERYLAEFPNIQAEWIFWATCGLALLRASRIPQAVLRRFTQPKRRSTEQSPRMVLLHHEIRCPAALTEGEIGGLRTADQTTLRIAEPTVVIAGIKGLITTFSYEIADPAGRKMAYETSFRLG